MNIINNHPFQNNWYFITGWPSSFKTITVNWLKEKEHYNRHHKNPHTLP